MPQSSPSTALSAYGAQLFGGSASRRVVKHHNKVSESSDEDTKEALADHGICSGITSTWIVGLVNGVAEARATGDSNGFETYFLNVLQHQGAYFKELHGKSEDHLAALARTIDHGATLISNGKARPVASSDLPAATTWAAYASIYGHAVGVGRAGDDYFIMDPNYGLFRYASQEALLTDLNQLIEARAAKKGAGSAKIGLWFYKPA